MWLVFTFSIFNFNDSSHFRVFAFFVPSRDRIDRAFFTSLMTLAKKVVVGRKRKELERIFLLSWKCWQAKVYVNSLVTSVQKCYFLLSGCDRHCWLSCWGDEEEREMRDIFDFAFNMISSWVTCQMTNSNNP